MQISVQNNGVDALGILSCKNVWLCGKVTRDSTSTKPNRSFYAFIDKSHYGNSAQYLFKKYFHRYYRSTINTLFGRSLCKGMNELTKGRSVNDGQSKIKKKVPTIDQR